jgi:AraC-like DNA-binding protein
LASSLRGVIITKNRAPHLQSSAVVAPLRFPLCAGAFGACVAHDYWGCRSALSTLTLSANGSVDVIVDPIPQALPTVTGFAVKCATIALKRRNVPIAPLLQRARISEPDFGDGQRITATAQSDFLERAADAVGDSAFGLHLAEQADPRDAGILFYVASGGKDLSEALALLARYFRIVNEAVRLKLNRTPASFVVEVNLLGIPRHTLRQNTEFGIAVILKALREVAGREIRPTRVAFAHSRNSNLREFERYYVCPVEFGAPSDLLEFSIDTLAVPLITADAKLVKTLQPFCDLAAKERNTAIGTLRSAVENEAQRLLPQGKAQRRTVAKTLAMSTRTLARRLADEGTTFEKVLDELRRSLALQYVKEPGMSLSQIAWLLGYEGSTSFNHAFLRWTGRSPTAARNEKVLPSPSQTRPS